jgi:hypothetical protein
MIVKSIISTMVKILAPITVVALAVFAYLYSIKSQSALYRFGQSAAKSTGGPYFSLLNPFRDRGPEQEAEAFLARVKTQSCSQALTGLALDQETFKYLCQMEDAHRLISWRLADREETGGKVKIFYWASRTTAGNFKSQLWITVEKADDNWRVSDYESWY